MTGCGRQHMHRPKKGALDNFPAYKHIQAHAGKTSVPGHKSRNRAPSYAHTASSSILLAVLQMWHTENGSAPWRHGHATLFTTHSPWPCNPQTPTYSVQAITAVPSNMPPILAAALCWGQHSIGRDPCRGKKPANALPTLSGVSHFRQVSR